MAEREPSIRCIREGNGNPDAIVFIHGFTGDGLRTWADLSGQIAGIRHSSPGTAGRSHTRRAGFPTSPESGLRTPICRSSLAI